jgi:hexokinase
MDTEKIKKNVSRFLKKYGMDPEDIDIENYCTLFIEEMQKGLAGHNSSLEMIPTYIEIGKEVPTNQPVIVIDAGGANFRVAAVYFNDQKKPVIENFRKYPMPGTKGKLTNKEFFNTMAGYLKDIVGKSHNIGFCFSYATEMFPNKDGKVIRLAKEVEVDGVQGQLIGENLIKAIKTSGHKGSKHVVVLNDTVAALLAGISSFPDRAFDSYIGFILGAGTNCCYVEQNKNIKKTLVRRLVRRSASEVGSESEGGRGLDPTKSQIINTESGAFGKGPMGKIDLEFDKSTINPGQGAFEKMISGAYFGPLCLRSIHAAADDGLFAASIGEKLKKIQNLETKDVNDFLYHPIGKTNPLSLVFDSKNEQPVLSRVDGDTVALYYLLDRLVERAAKLTAIKLASVTIKSGKGRNPCRPVCIVAEGTVFYQLKSLKQRVECCLKKYLEGEKGIYYEIVSVDNATLIGAAIAGLTN